MKYEETHKLSDIHLINHGKDKRIILGQVCKGLTILHDMYSQDDYREQMLCPSCGTQIPTVLSIRDINSDTSICESCFIAWIVSELDGFHLSFGQLIPQGRC